jgi:hypothetical protein
LTTPISQRLLMVGERTGDLGKMLTQSALYEVAGGALSPLAAGLGLPELAIVAPRPGAGTGGAPLLYVADEASANIAVIDAGAAPPTVSSIKSGISAPWDMLWDEQRSRLLVLAGYRLYAVDAGTGKTTALMNIPDGPEYPKVYGAVPGGDTFYFSDFTFVYTVDLRTNKVIDKAPFTASPRTIGLPGPVAVQA